MATTRRLSMLARSLPAMLALLLISGINSPAVARPDPGRKAEMSTAAVQQPAPRDTAPVAPTRSRQPATAMTATRAPVADRTRIRPTQHAADAASSRAPPAHHA